MGPTWFRQGSGDDRRGTSCTRKTLSKTTANDTQFRVAA